MIRSVIRWLWIVSLVLVIVVHDGAGQEVRLSRLQKLRPVQMSECSAAIKLPTGSEKKVVNVKMNEAMARSYTYTSPLTDRQFMIHCGPSPWIIDDIDTLNFAYDFDGKQVLRGPQDENTTVSEIIIKGHPGREFTSTRANGSIYMKAWLVIVGDKRYFLTFGGPKRRDESEPSGHVRQQMQDFFGSFGVTKVIKPITLPLQESLPAGYLGELKSGTYTNKAFGFSLKIPDGWVEIPISQIEGFLDSAEADQPTRKRFAIPISFVSKRPYGQSPFGALNIVIQKAIFRGSSMRAAAENDRDNSVRSGSGTIGEDISETVIDGRKFMRFRLDTPVADRMFKQLTYMTETKGFGIFFHLQYFDETELRELEALIQTVRFAK